MRTTKDAKKHEINNLETTEYTDHTEMPRRRSRQNQKSFVVYMKPKRKEF